MSPSSVAISGKRVLNSETCVQQESIGILKLEVVVVVLQQEGSFDTVVIVRQTYHYLKA